MLRIDTKHYQEVIRHSQTEFPKECCGILAGAKGEVKKVYKMTNASDDPIHCYFMDSKEQLKVIKEIRNEGLEMLAIYHSHPYTEAFPSPRDVNLANYPEVFYIIISFKDRDNPDVRIFNIVNKKIKEQNLYILGLRYFPINIDVNNKGSIVIGGGKIAERKINTLLNFGATVKVISPTLTKGLLDFYRKRKISWIKRSYKNGDLKGAFLVIAATDDKDINSKVSQEGKKKNILVNVVDNPNLSNFISPSILKRGIFTISISTDGKFPKETKRLRIFLQKMIPKV